MDFNALFLGFVLRLGQFFLEAAVTLVVGVLVAGVLRRMLGPAGTRKLFGQGCKGLFRGWLAGMLLPVCSLGVIPVAREMRRAGVPGGTVLAFVLAAPLLNPISFLYGLTLAEPVVICCFAVASLFLSTVAGILWDQVFARSTSASEAEAASASADEPAPSHGLRRLLAVALTASREMTGANLGYYAFGLVGSALLAAIIPFGMMQTTMKHSDPTSPLLMTLVGVPIYAAPISGMMKIGLMFEHGNSVGAAFVLFVLGIGTNVGLLLWLMLTYKPGRSLGWLAVWIGVIVGLAYLAEPILFDKSKEEIDHTHAFDDYSCPFPADGSGIAYLLPLVGQKLAEKCQPLEIVSSVTLLLLLVVGTVVSRWDHSGAIEGWLTAKSPELTTPPAAWWNRSLSGPVLGVIAILGLIAFSVVGAYVYYPEKELLFTELGRVRNNANFAIRQGQREIAIRELEQMDLLLRKLQVSVYLRTGKLSAQARKAADDLCEELEEIRDLVIAGQGEQAKEKLASLEEHYRTCRQAYR